MEKSAEHAEIDDSTIDENNPLITFILTQFLFTKLSKNLNH